MEQDLINDITRQYEELKTDRGVWNGIWQDLADYIVPNFRFITESGKAEDRFEKVYDDTAVFANEQFASLLSSHLVPVTEKWFDVVPARADLRKIVAVNSWFQKVTEIMFDEAFNSPSSLFSQQAHEIWLTIGSFCTSVFYVDESNGSVRFLSIPLKDCYIDEDENGLVDTLFRVNRFSPRQYIAKFGKDNAPQAVIEAFEKGKCDKIEVVHAVLPRTNRDHSKIDSLNKPWASIYIDCNNKTIVSEGGYDEFPYMVPRYSKMSGERYGRGPGFSVLQTVKVVNFMTKIVLKTAQKVMSPPLQVPDDSFMLPIRTRPDAINYYRSGTSDRIEPLQTGGNPIIGEELMTPRKEFIERAFFIHALQMPDKDRMTATEVRQRNEENLRIMAPMVNRLQAELLNPMIERVFNILARNNRFPELPPELSGQDYRIEYSSPLIRAQKASAVYIAQDWIGTIGNLASISPDIMDKVDTDAFAEWSGQVLNVHADLIRSEEEVNGIREERAQRQAAAEKAALQNQEADTAMKEAKAGGQNG